MSSYQLFQYEHNYVFTPLPVGRFFLHQIGDLCCAPGKEIPGHVQACHEISLIESGEAEFIINGQSYNVQKGDMILSLKGDSHFIRSSVEHPVRFFYFAITFNEDAPDYDTFQNLESFFETTSIRLVNNPMDLNGLFLKSFNELKINDVFFVEMIESYLTQLLVCVYRNMKKLTAPVYSPPFNNYENDDLIYKIINLIDSGKYTVKNLKDISKAVGYSYPYISLLFSQKVNRTIMEYCQSKMFEKATQMLDNGVSITQIAENLGYKSIHSFSRAFSKYFGYPPSKHTKKNDH